MNKKISKVLALVVVFVLTMSMVVFAAPAISSGADSTIVNVTGVTPGDEVTLLAVPTGTDLATLTEDQILYIDQVASDGEGNATFEIAIDAATADIYSGYSSMADDDEPLKLVYNGGSAPVTKTYKVTFKDVDGGVIEVKEVEEGKTVDALPTAPEVEGFTFKGWFVGEDEFSTATVITTDLSVDAVYEETVAVEVVYGDLDGDGVPTLNDAILTLKIAAGTITGTADQVVAGDVDKEAGVTLNDAILVLKRAAGTISKLPVEE